MSHEDRGRAGGVFTSAAEMTRQAGTGDQWSLTNQGRASDAADQWEQGRGLIRVVSPDRLATLVSLGHPVTHNYKITPKSELGGAFEIQEHLEALKINHLWLNVMIDVLL